MTQLNALKKKKSATFECQIFVSSPCGNEKRFGRIYNKSEDILELSRLYLKKKIQFLGEERDSEKKKGSLAAYAVSL